MAGRLSAELEGLSLEDALRLMYGAYRHLAEREDEVASSTCGLLRRLQKREPEAFVFCFAKMLEEQEEVRLALAGQHRHEGQGPRDTMVNELQQLLYWPCLLVAARGLPYDALEAPAFLEAGLTGRAPGKDEIGAGVPDEGAIFRRALVQVGRAVAEFNEGPLALPPIEPREAPLADLRQMAEKDYLCEYLQAELGLAGPQPFPRSTPMNAPHDEVEVTVPGEWFSRPANQDGAAWVRVTATPATVRITDGEAYRLRVGFEASDDDLRGLMRLRGVAGLQALDLGNCSRVTDAGLAHLRELTQLQSLDIQWCEAVTDVGLAHLANLVHLRHLDLTWVTEMTNAGLAALHGLTQLRSLVLDCCWNVTSEGVSAFRARAPDCVIEGA